MATNIIPELSGDTSTGPPLPQTHCYFHVVCSCVILLVQHLEVVPACC